MQNDQDTAALTRNQRAFIEAMGQHMVGWGLPRTTGRVYAYLLLQEEPAGLDRVCADLGVARSGASMALRQLVHFGMARVLSAGGSRRLLYEVLDGLEAVMSARDAQARALASHLRQGARAAGPARAANLTAMADTMERILAELPLLVDRLGKEGPR